VSSPNVAPFIKQTALAYFENGILEHFFTTFYEHRKKKSTQFLGKLLPKLKKEFGRRDFSELDYSLISGTEYSEILRVIAARYTNDIIADYIWEWSEHRFDKWVSKKLDKTIDLLHTYENAGLFSMQRAKDLGIKIIYEQPSIHYKYYNNIIAHQIEEFPELITDSIRISQHQKSERRFERKDRELCLSDKIICNSTFTKNTLINGGIAENKIGVIPLGFPLNCEFKKTHVNKKLIFMYAGNLTIGKGIHLLIEAWKKIGIPATEAELWLFGKNSLPKILLNNIPSNIFFFGNVPHDYLMDKYEQADVFIFPTLADGFGMVITEAMSKGLPVIATTNCAAPDIVDNLKEGFIVDPGNVDALIDKIIWCIDNRSDLRGMGHNAFSKAQQYGWEAYRKKIIDFVYL
jgi:glycosyltransferase involved in cell wall biosynthesis